MVVFWSKLRILESNIFLDPTDSQRNSEKLQTENTRLPTISARTTNSPQASQFHQCPAESHNSKRFAGVLATIQKRFGNGHLNGRSVSEAYEIFKTSGISVHDQ